MNTLDNILKMPSEEEGAQSKRLAEIKEQGWDLFLRVLGDGSMIVTALAVSTCSVPHVVVSTKHLEYRS